MKDREFATVARFSSMERFRYGLSVPGCADLPKAKQLMKAKFDKESFKDAWKE